MYSDHLDKFIPEEFNLEKYEVAANMPLECWLVNLSMRFLGYISSKTPMESFDDSQKALIRNINTQNIQSGVITDQRINQLLNELIMHDQSESSSVVKEITYLELFLLADNLKSPELEKLYIETELSTFSVLNQDNAGKLNDFISTSDIYPEDELSFLQVDMNNSDNEIKSAFSGWLQQEREKRKSDKTTNRREHQMKNFNTVTFRKWHDARVIAYLDLITWNCLEGNKVTSKILGDILFPETSIRDTRDTTAMINDTIKPLANKLADRTVLKRMANVIADKNRQKIT
ncbi:hypothetical protein E8Q33_09885 [Methylophaga sp. SB9B]|uniref:DUF6387 family protein n=1 Tax=Methylophaga sp. SB9B TaxID=2570356 RepID=UPI0010A7997E|nr:DUF6387 family protein [Methylophaga sp. SB9B]THK41104.1 hypothetical protein E8Q33_09885 [Methylophaga sp. SB9B]